MNNIYFSIWLLMLHLRHTEYLLIIRLSVINYFGMSPELLKIALIISRRENETGAKNGLNYETIAFESIERRNGRGRITYTCIHHVDDTK